MSIQRLVQTIEQCEPAELDYGTLRTLGFICHEADKQDRRIKELEAERDDYKAKCLDYIDWCEEKDKRIAELEVDISAWKDGQHPSQLFEACCDSDLREQLTQANAEIAELEAELDGIKSVADESDGVIGWHLNGDLATWQDLFPEWYEEQQVKDKAND